VSMSFNRSGALLAAIAAVFLLDYTVAAQGGAAELGASMVALQQLKSQLDSVIGTVDAETAARIRQVEIALDGAIRGVKDAMDHGYGLINNTRDQVMGNIAATMVQAQDMIQSSTSLALLGVNDSLANTARVVTSIPGISVPTYVYAITPMRFSVNAADPLLQVHGFFPDVSTAHPVTVRIDDGSTNGVTLALDQFVNNTVAFRLPASVLSREDHFVSMAFNLPVARLWGLYYTTTSVKARVYVERTFPFEFDVVVSVENPELWAQVSAPGPVVEHADSSRTENSQTFTAPELFARLVNDNAAYDMSSAHFVAFSGRVDQGSNPCASGCTSSSGSWSWDNNKDTVTFALHAPSCPAHMISPGFPQIPYQCGGGTHADFFGTPTFRVRRREVQQLEKEASSQTVRLRHQSVSEAISLPPNWTSIEIRGRLWDGGSARESHARLTSGSAGMLSASEAIVWKAEVSGASLLITTR
jgi:hypothetical protein